MLPQINTYLNSKFGFVELEFAKDETVIAAIKAIPGRKWLPRQRRWLFPLEALGTLSDVATVVPQQGPPRRFPIPQDLPEGLTEEQQLGVQVALQDGATLLRFDTGRGKTRTAIETVRQITGRCLIVCPAGVRGNWVREARKWGVDAEISTLWSQKDLEKPLGDWVVTSYEMTKKLLAKHPRPWDAIVFDEIHYVCNPKSARYKHAKEFVDLNPGALRLGLTATPMLSEPEQIWGVLDVLWPGRFGTYWQFVFRYCNTIEGPHGVEIDGLSKEHLPELKSRLTAVKVESVWPPADLPVPKVLVRKTQNATEGVTFADLWLSGLESHQAMKAGWAVERAKAHEGKRLCILTWMRDLAKKIANELPGSLCVTGDMPPKKRDKMLQEHEGTLVATIASVKEGIDLGHYQVVTCAELYFSPTPMIQVMGRFRRMNRDTLPDIEMLCAKPSLDEVVARVVQRRIKESQQLTKNQGAASLVAGLEAKEDETTALKQQLEQLAEEDSVYGNLMEYLL